MSKVAIIILLSAVVLSVSFLIPKNKNEGVTFDKSRICPDSWIDNQMPRIKDDSKEESRQYFIIDGERQEIEDYDLGWIQENCDSKPQIVY